MQSNDDFTPGIGIRPMLMQATRVLANEVRARPHALPRRQSASIHRAERRGKRRRSSGQTGSPHQPQSPLPPRNRAGRHDKGVKGVDEGERRAPRGIASPQSPREYPRHHSVHGGQSDFRLRARSHSCSSEWSTLSRGGASSTALLQGSTVRILEGCYLRGQPFPDRVRTLRAE